MMACKEGEDVYKSTFMVSLLLLGLASGPSHSYDAYGAGSASCRVWVKEQAAEDKNPLYWLLHGWVAGYVSGAGYGDTQLTKTDVMRDYVTMYCQRQPSKRVSDVAESLVKELAKDK